MKEIIEKKMVEQVNVIYVANDGTEFDNENACSRYELGQNREKLERELKEFVTDIPSFMLSWTNDTSIQVAHITSQHQLNMLLAFFEEYSMDYYGFPFVYEEDITLVYCVGDCWANTIGKYDKETEKRIDQTLEDIIEDFNATIKALKKVEKTIKG